MNKGYEIQVSRAPDGQVIFTRDANVPLQQECVVLDGETPADAVFIHLQILHKAPLDTLWVCQPPDLINDPDLVRRFTVDRKDEITDAFRQWQERRGNR